MNRSIGIWYFSSTGNGRKLAVEINSLFPEDEVNVVDITSIKMRVEMDKSCKYSFLVIIFPIYAGDVPEILKSFFKTLNGNGTRTCLIATYGNVHTGNALFNAEKILHKSDFKIVSGAEIIAPHSYNNEHVKLGIGRPDKEELKKLNNLICKYVIKNDEITFPKEKLSLKAKLILLIPQNFVRRISSKLLYKRELCTHCGLCMQKCPVGAVKIDFETDGRKCIRCLACTYCCPFEAKQFEFTNPAFEKFLTSNGSQKRESNFYPE